MIVSSCKREYVIGLNQRLADRVRKHLKSLSEEDLKLYINACFRKANKLGSSSRSGAWGEAKVWRDKAKLGVIECDNRLTT